MRTNNHYKHRFEFYMNTMMITGKANYPCMREWSRKRQRRKQSWELFQDAILAEDFLKSSFPHLVVQSCSSFQSRQGGRCNCCRDCTSNQRCAWQKFGGQYGLQPGWSLLNLTWQVMLWHSNEYLKKSNHIYMQQFAGPCGRGNILSIWHLTLSIKPPFIHLINAKS